VKVKFLALLSDLYDDETLRIINKPKDKKKGENKEQNGRTHVQEDKRKP
jgi:hypothetical protein